MEWIAVCTKARRSDSFKVKVGKVCKADDMGFVTYYTGYKSLLHYRSFEHFQNVWYGSSFELIKTNEK